MNKLEACGADKETLNQMGGLIGGAGENYDFVIKNLIADQKNRIAKKMASLQSGNPADSTEIANVETDIIKAETAAKGLQSKVDGVSSKIQDAQKNYKDTIKQLVNSIRELLIALTSLEKDLDGIPAGNAKVTLDKIKEVLARLNSVLDQTNVDDKFKVDGTTQDEINNYIVDTYFNLLIDSMVNEPAKFHDGAKYSDQLSVEMRQLAQLMKLTKSSYTDDEAKTFVKDLFSKFVNDPVDLTPGTKGSGAVKIFTTLTSLKKSDGTTVTFNTDVIKALNELAKKWADKDKTPTIQDVFYTKPAATAAATP
jgi:hypothetical protein